MAGWRLSADVNWVPPVLFVENPVATTASKVPGEDAATDVVMRDP